MTKQINLFPIDQSPGLILAKAHGLLRLSLTKVFVKNGFDITPSHWAILGVLWEKDNIIQTDLAKWASTDRPNLTRILAKLEKRGFVRRERKPNDLRSYTIMLTKKGREAQAPLTALVNDHLQKTFKDLSQEEYEVGFRMLRMVINNLNSFANSKN